MDWLSEVNKRYRRNNQILFSKESEYLQDLRMLFEEQDHKTMVLWAMDFAAESVAVLETRYHWRNDPERPLKRPGNGHLGRLRAICTAKDTGLSRICEGGGLQEDVALCHAVGQACSVVHTAGHAIGYPAYDLTAIIHRYGIDACREAVESRKGEYVEKLFYWSGQTAITTRSWAAFLCQ